MENSIDKAMAVYKGQSALKQYMSKKPIQRDGVGVIARTGTFAVSRFIGNMLR